MSNRRGKRKRHPFWSVMEIIFGILLGIWLAMTLRGV